MKTIEEVIAKLEKDLKTYESDYNYALLYNGITAGSGAYEEAQDILNFIKGDNNGNS